MRGQWHSHSLKLIDALIKLALAGAAATPIERLTLVDRAAPPADLASDARVNAVVGDLNDLLANDAARAVPADAALVFHLAAAVGVKPSLVANRAAALLASRLRAVTSPRAIPLNAPLPHAP